MAKTSAFSKTVVGSYVLDWVVIIVAAAIGAVLNNITPYKRPFDLSDQDISFPYVTHEKISTLTLVLVSLIAPVIVVIAICIALVPGPTLHGKVPKKLIWRRKCWETYTGLTGLALSCALAFLITQGMKNLFGRPRPDLLSRCDADYANAINFAVGALAPGNITLRVSQTICQNTDKNIMDDGFRSFPSGHSSFSCAGLVFLSLFLASKLSITLPYLAPETLARTSRALSSSSPTQNNGNGNHVRPRHIKISSSTTESAEYAQASGHDDVQIAARDQAASPPLYLLVIAAAPSFAAIYIAATRFTDFRHHAFDILFGQFIGITTAWFAFRWYHLPIRQGAGWSWGPRSKKRAFWAGIGRGVYCEIDEERVGRGMRRYEEGNGGENDMDVDLEAGQNINGQRPERGEDGMSFVEGQGGIHDGLNVR